MTQLGPISAPLLEDRIPRYFFFFLFGIISFFLYRIIPQWHTHILLFSYLKTKDKNSDSISPSRSHTISSTSIISCRVKLLKGICVCCLQYIKLRFSDPYPTKTAFIEVTINSTLLSLKIILPLSFYSSYQQHSIIHKSHIFENVFTWFPGHQIHLFFPPFLAALLKSVLLIFFSIPIFN